MGNTLQSRTPSTQLSPSGFSASLVGVAAKKLDSRYLAQIAVVFFAYFVAGKLGQATANIRSSNLGPVWPAYGVALAAILLVGYRAWVGVASAAFLVASLSPVPVITAFGQAAGSTLAALVGAFLLHRLANFDLSLTRLRDALSLLLIGALGSAIVSASIGMSVLFATHQHAYSGIVSAWLIYWLGDGMGVMLVTPLVLTLAALFRIRDPYRLLELASLLLLLTVICVIVFGHLPMVPAEVHVLALAVLPFVMWAAIRFGVSGAALSVLVVATIATIETALGTGPFVINDSFTNGVLLDVFFGVLSITGLALGVLRSEQELAQREREGMVRMQAAIEAHRQSQKLVQESEERLRLAIQAGKMYAYEWDPTTDLTVRSGGVTNILGSTDEGLSVPRQPLLDRIHADDRALFEASVTERTPEDPDIQTTYRLMRPDGSVTWLEKTMRAFFDEHGKLVRTVGMVADISERKRAEETLLRYSALVESSQDAIISKNLDLVITTWNASAQRIFGYTEAEAVGQPITILIPPELMDEESRILEKLRAGERIEHRETIRVTKGGKRVNVSLSISPIRDASGKVTGFSKIARDITDRKRAVEALRASEERLRSAQQAARVGTFEWNIQTGVNTWTPELEEMYGLPPGGFGGTQTAFENLVHPDDRAGIIELNNWALKTGKPTKGEWRVVWPDGSVHWITGRWQVYMNESGQPWQMVGANMDITDRKLAEQELAQANERLYLAMEYGSVGGWDYDLKTGKNLWFGKAHAQLGMTPDETPGSRKEFWERVHKDDRARVERALQLAKEKHQDFAEDVRVVWRDGTTHWLRSLGRYHYGANGEAERSLGISLDITERKLAEEALLEMNRTLEAQGSLLRSREELLRVFVKNVPAAVAMFDREMRYIEVSNCWCTTFSVDGSKILGRSHYDFFPDLPERFKEIHRRALAGEAVRVDEDRWDRECGTMWSRFEVHPWKTSEGAVGGILIFIEDITRRKQMEETLSAMSRKLIEAQEQERARIGRELHDDITQRLAMLAVDLSLLETNPSNVQSRVQKIRERTIEISEDVQALSHELHSAKLEYLGVVAGIKSWCKDFAERQRIEIDFKNDVSSVLPFEVGLSLFRVLQEALHNAIKHSGVKRIEVQLAERPNEVHMVISDSGKGFDVEKAKQHAGLGLTSMRERIRLVNGDIAIHSKPMAGTTIYVRVPLRREHVSQTAKGSALGSVPYHS